MNNINTFTYNYGEVIEGIFISRPNRFIAEVMVEGEIIIAHVKNTGRLKELLVSGRKCFIKKATNLNRKTKYDLISIEYENIYVNLDSQIPNDIIAGAFKNGLITDYENVKNVKREVKVGDSRLDMVIEFEDYNLFVEVKQANLVKNKIAMFPDAITSRGKKHLRELERLNDSGNKTMVIFLIARDDVKLFRPHIERDEEFSNTLYEVSEKGVLIRAYNSIVGPNYITFKDRIRIMDKEEAINDSLRIANETI